MKKRVPLTPYECFYMNCLKCVYYDETKKTCNHPMKYPDYEL